MKTNVFVVVLISAVAVSGFVGWWVNGAIWSGKYSELDKEYSDYREDRLNAEMDMQLDHLAEIERRNEAAAAVDEKHFKELMNVQSSIDDVLNGNGGDGVGMYVRAETNCGDRESASDSTTTGVDDGTALVKLGREDARTLWRWAGYSDETGVMFSALQDWVRDVCIGRVDR